MKAMKRVALIMGGISAIYLLIAAVLSLTEICFRSWVDVFGKMIAGILTPIMLLALALAFLCSKEQVRQSVKTACIVSSVIVCSIYAWFAMFFILLGSEEERTLTRHLLVTNESFLGETNPVYYRKVSFLFKRPGEITSADKKEYLEKKYQRTFGVFDSNGRIYDWDFPEVVVSVWPEGMSLADNYVEELTIACLFEAYHSLKMEREYHITKEGLDGLAYFCLEASGFEDIPALSKDISRLYQYVLRDRTHKNTADIYKEHIGAVYYSFEEDENDFTGVIQFGGMNEDAVIDVEALVRIGYGRYEERLARRVPDPYEKDKTEDEGNAAGLYPEPEPEPEPDYREEAAAKVFASELAAEGFSFEVCYNAKGNLYIDLGTKPSDEEEGLDYSYRLVYDRTSKNGACELFVLYCSLEGADEEAIVDMYAVETATGKVVVSGKKAWSDVGTEEYREMTGE